MSNQFSSDSKEPSGENHEVREWVNKLLVGLSVLVFGYVGSELGDLKRTIVETKVVIQRVADMERWLNDHEQRIRELERQSRLKKGE